jgi:hypothetical protein
VIRSNLGSWLIALGVGSSFEIRLV